MNTASRMESHGEGEIFCSGSHKVHTAWSININLHPACLVIVGGKIQISPSTMKIISADDRFSILPRGEISIKAQFF
jgi:hypothetical protein